MVGYSVVPMAETMAEQRVDYLATKTAAQWVQCWAESWAGTMADWKVENWDQTTVDMMAERSVA